MTDVVLLEASLFQLQTVMPAELEFTVSVLANAVAAAHDGVNAARVNDIAFALNDVIGAAESLSAADAAMIEPAMQALRADVAALKEATALPPEVVAAIDALRAKLAARKSAIERQQYVEGGGDPLPHPPEELAGDAVALRARLAESGFATPAIDAFLDNPAELRFHGIVEMIDELEVILPSS
jgi:hypothetical protein